MLFDVSLPKSLMLPTVDLLKQDPDLVFILLVNGKGSTLLPNSPLLPFFPIEIFFTPLPPLSGMWGKVKGLWEKMGKIFMQVWGRKKYFLFFWGEGIPLHGLGP